MAARSFGQRDAVMQEADQSSEGEFKRVTPPPDALEQILRGWRLSQESESVGSGMSESHCSAEYSGNQDDDNDDSMGDTRPTPSSDTGKRSRYLREADRHAIIKRIDDGERQVELAREYGVTRAAVCHINKNRAEILARSSRPDVHAAARHPKRRMAKTAIAQRQQRRQQQQLGEHVYKTRSPALTVHLATLRNPATDSRTFRATADRALLLLIEEALASVASVDSPTCAMVMSESGFPLLQAFRSVQPDSATGFMTLSSNEDGELTLRKMSAPLDLRDQTIFLLSSTCATALEVSTAIQALLDVGANESTIVLVTLVITTAAVVEIHDQFPSVRIVVAAVDREASPDLGNFLERYFNTTTIVQSGAGSTVDV